MKTENEHTIETAINYVEDLLRQVEEYTPSKNPSLLELVMVSRLKKETMIQASS
jgi:hypothetical protein